MDSHKRVILRFHDAELGDGMPDEFGTTARDGKKTKIPTRGLGAGVACVGGMWRDGPEREGSRYAGPVLTRACAGILGALGFEDVIHQRGSYTLSDVVAHEFLGHGLPVGAGQGGGA